MKSVLTTMQKAKNGDFQDILPVFENIIQKYQVPGSAGTRDACEAEFVAAMEEHLTPEQRFRLFEQNGACKGTGYDKERKAFALAHTHLTLAERLSLYTKTYGGKAVLSDDRTITVSFACTHGYYKQVREGKLQSLPPSIKSYFERCAGGRMYEYQKALGIKLRIKSVDISPLSEAMSNPVVFTFEVVT